MSNYKIPLLKSDDDFEFNVEKFNNIMDILSQTNSEEAKSILEYCLKSIDSNSTVN